MRCPAVRTRAPRNKEQRVGENGGSDRGNDNDRQDGNAARCSDCHPRDNCKRRIVESSECGVLNVAEEVRARCLDDAFLGEPTSCSPPSLPQHEKRGVETNSAEYRDRQLKEHALKSATRGLAAFALLAASFALAYVVIRYQPQVEHVLRAYYPWTYPLAVAVFALVAAAPFSVTDALAVMNGAIFGPLFGSIINAVGLVIAALIGYWVNRHASRLLDLDSYLERLPKWIKRFPVGSPAFLIGVRVIPGFGGTVATATAAAFRVPVWVHVWTMCAVAIPLCTILAIFGNQVTLYVHKYEARARFYIEHHHFRLHFHFREHPTAPPPTP